MSMSFESDSDLADFMGGAIYEGVDHLQAVQIASDLSKKYDFLSANFILWGWAQLPEDDLSMKISKKELDALYRKVRSDAQSLIDALSPFHVAIKINGVQKLIAALDGVLNVETPKKDEFQYMNECMFLGGVALAYDRMYPHERFKNNDLLIKAVLDIQRSFNLRRKHSPSEDADDPNNSLNRYLQRGRKQLKGVTQERHRMTEK